MHLKLGLRLSCYVTGVKWCMSTYWMRLMELQVVRAKPCMCSGHLQLMELQLVDDAVRGGSLGPLLTSSFQDLLVCS